MQVASRGWLETACFSTSLCQILACLHPGSPVEPSLRQSSYPAWRFMSREVVYPDAPSAYSVLFLFLKQGATRVFPFDPLIWIPSPSQIIHVVSDADAQRGVNHASCCALLFIVDFASAKSKSAWMALSQHAAHLCHLLTKYSNISSEWTPVSGWGTHFQALGLLFAPDIYFDILHRIQTVSGSLLN